MTVQCHWQQRGERDGTWHGGLTDKTCSHPVDFPFVSIECELWWPYFLIWHQHWENLDWNNWTHWFDLLVFEWPFFVHNEAVCCHWLCIDWEESRHSTAAAMMEECSQVKAILKWIFGQCFFSWERTICCFSDIWKRIQNSKKEEKEWVCTELCLEAWCKKNKTMQ